ncbi:MAG: hypothetical protein MJ073_02755 [Oscillibacter sp.]|nr:hypothetical protein [Oscillibacter sp.]
MQILIGRDHTESYGMEVAKRIEQLFKDRCTEFKERYNLNFGVYYSPAENLCHIFRQKTVIFFLQSSGTSHTQRNGYRI